MPGFIERIFGTGKKPEHREKLSLADIIERGLRLGRGEDLPPLRGPSSFALLGGLKDPPIVEGEQDFLRTFITESANAPQRIGRGDIETPQQALQPVFLPNVDPDIGDIGAQALGASIPELIGSVTITNPVGGAVAGAAEEAVMGRGPKDIALGAAMGAVSSGVGRLGRKFLTRYANKALNQIMTEGPSHTMPLAIMRLQDDMETAMVRAQRAKDRPIEQAFQEELEILQKRRKAPVALLPAGTGKDVAPVVEEASHTLNKALNNIEMLRQPLKFADDELEAIASEFRRVEGRAFSPIGTGRVSAKGRQISPQFVNDTILQKNLKAQGLSSKASKAITENLDAYERTLLGEAHQRGAREAATAVTQSLTKVDPTVTLKDAVRLGRELRDTPVSRSRLTGEDGFVQIGNMARNATDATRRRMKKFTGELKRKTGVDGTGYWLSSLLMSFKTAAVNAFGSIPDTALEAGVRGVRGLVFDRSMIQPFSQFQGMMNGLSSAGKNAADAFKTGLIKEMREGNDKAIAELTAATYAPLQGPAHWIKFFPKIMAATDDFWTTVNFSADIFDQAYRKASQKGLSGKALIDEGTRIAQNPTTEMIKNGMEAGRRSVFRDTPGEITKPIFKITKAIQDYPYIGRFALPFAQTLVNISKRGLEYSPYGFLNAIGSQLFGKGGETSLKSFIRASIGTPAMAGVYALAQSDKISGRWEHLTSGQKQAKIVAGEKPSAIKVGEKTWVSYEGLGPISMMLGIPANAWETTKHTGKPMAGIVDGLGQETLVNALEATFVPTFWDLFSGLANSDQFGYKAVERAMGSLMTMFVPRPLQDLAKVIDPTTREVSPIKHLKDEYDINFPDPVSVLSKKLPFLLKEKGQETSTLPKLGVFGEELQTHGLLSKDPTLLDVVSPFRATQISEDPLRLEMARLIKVLPDHPKARWNAPSFSSSAAGVRPQKFNELYSEQEIYDIRKAKGFLQEEAMRRIFESQGYQRWDDNIKASVLKKAFERPGGRVNRIVRAWKKQGKTVTQNELLRALGVR